MRAWRFGSLLLLLLSGCPRSLPKADTIAIGCSLFSTDGKLLKRYLGWTCAFFPNGKMLLGDGFTLTFYDEKMNPVWTRDVHNYRRIAYDPEAGIATVITSRILQGTSRIDRLEVYDTEGRLLSHYEFQPEQGEFKVKQTWDLLVLGHLKHSLTLIESFYRIGRNSSSLPYLAEGNFLAFDASGRLFVFDPALRLLRTVRVPGFPEENGQARDVQVTPAGNLLFYNSGNRMEGKPFTSIDEVDPASGRLVWTYRADPPTALFGAYEGSVQLLPNGNVLFGVVMDHLKGKDRKGPGEGIPYEPWMDVRGFHESFEVTRSGRVAWKMVNDGSGLTGMPNEVKRYDLSDYLRKKGRY